LTCAGAAAAAPDRWMVWTEPETSGGIMFQFVQRH
jgi:hypothetical protein